MTSRNCVLSYELSSLFFCSWSVPFLYHVYEFSAMVVSCFPLYSNWISHCQCQMFDRLLTHSFDTSFHGSPLAWLVLHLLWKGPCGRRCGVLPLHQIAGGEECCLWWRWLRIETGVHQNCFSQEHWATLLPCLCLFLPDSSWTVLYGNYELGVLALSSRPPCFSLLSLINL